MSRLFLECDGLSYGYDAGLALFKDLSFRIQGGSLLLVKGGNGSGKTTLLKICAGIISPQAGKVFRHERADYLGHENGFYPDLTVRENLYFWEKLLHREFAQELILYFQLEDSAHRPVKYLSFGQRRKVALGRILLGSPAKIIFLDEPFQGLDVETRNAAEALVRGRMRRGVSFILSTHNSVSESLAEEALCVQL